MNRRHKACRDCYPPVIAGPPSRTPAPPSFSSHPAWFVAPLEFFYASLAFFRCARKVNSSSSPPSFFFFFYHLRKKTFLSRSELFIREDSNATEIGDDEEFEIKKKERKKSPALTFTKFTILTPSASKFTLSLLLLPNLIYFNLHQIIYLDRPINSFLRRHFSSRAIKTEKMTFFLLFFFTTTFTTENFRFIIVGVFRDRRKHELPKTFQLRNTTPTRRIIYDGQKRRSSRCLFCSCVLCNSSFTSTRIDLVLSSSVPEGHYSDTRVLIIDRW